MVRRGIDLGGSVRGDLRERDDQPFCWGYNSGGQVGDGTITNRWCPVPVGSSADWQTVSMGTISSYALLDA